MEPRAHHVLIGLFTLVVITAGLIAALWLGKYGKDTSVATYEVIFNEPVRGLSRGSAVQFNGIKVGEVSALSLDPNDVRNVRALITIQDGIPIQTDTRARLMLAGITGISVVALSSGQPGSPLLKAKPGQDYPEIIATPSPIAQFMQNGDSLLTGMAELMTNANKFLSGQNAESFTRTIQNLETVSGALADNRDDIETLLNTLTAATQQFTTTLQAADRLIRVEGTASMQQARTALASVDAAAANVAQLVQSNQGAVSTGLQGLNELGPTLQELRMTLAALRNNLRKLDNNPAGYLLGAESLKEVAP
ncbi:ABC transporter permease [Pusillimonas sp. T2]|uniref:MlaD family protein n=1 Tax=Pusillimonas sp. T2 TaxID=1548123 RepID=UPI000B8E7300|nr:MlaD family protein [Pusillimonas sp. T2]OXR49341.1 ABC transporter permease [Pusillimonas sp. T2]